MAQPEIDDQTRDLIAQHVAASQQIAAEEARRMVDDVCQRWQDSPYVTVVWPVVGAILRPIIDAMATADPGSPDDVSRVMSVAEKAMKVGPVNG